MPEQIEIRDSTGKLLGYFIPGQQEEPSRDYSAVRKLFDPDELRRRNEAAKSEGRRPMAEVVKLLEEKEKERSG
jgi:hypothetical protein